VIPVHDIALEFSEDDPYHLRLDAFDRRGFGLRSPG
jgi:hypothetical protein